MIADLQGLVADHTFVHAAWWFEQRAGGDVCVAADDDGGAGLLCCSFVLWVGGAVFWVGGESAHEIPAYAYFGLDDGAPPEGYVLCAVELRFARYFVAGVCFDVVAFGLGGGFGGH